MAVKERIKVYVKSQGMTISDFEKSILASNGYVNSISKSIGVDKLELILEKYPNLSFEWLLTGKGEMFNRPESTKERKKIPVFDAETFGGVNERIVNMEGVSAPSEWIDAGDWFMNATAAMHHYGDSMVEYPPGCILALREIFDWNIIVWGKNYVIETDELRITKRLQRGNSDECVIAYSTNTDTYPDGKLIHEPIPIPKESIRRLAIVLGYVVKEQSSGMVYNIRNKR